MKRILMSLMLAAMLLISVTATADTVMKPITAVEHTGSAQLGGQVFITELVNGKANLDAFVLIENASGSFKEYADGILVYGTANGVMGLITLYARDPIAVRNREVVLYSGSGMIELDGRSLDDLAFVAEYSFTDSDHGAGLARYMDIEIKDANSPGAKKMSVKAKDIQKGNYSIIFIVYDQKGQIVFADTEIMSSQHSIVSAYIEDREVEAIADAGSQLKNAAAILYTRTP